MTQALTFALRHKREGYFVHLDNNRPLTLIEGPAGGENFPVYTQPTVRKLLSAAKRRGPQQASGYDIDEPFGSLDLDDYEVVRQTSDGRSVVVEYVELPELTSLKKERKPRRLCKTYLKGFDPGVDYIDMHVLEMPEGKTLEDLQADVDRTVFEISRGDKSDAIWGDVGAFILRGVFTLPEEFTFDLKQAVFGAFVESVSYPEVDYVNASKPIFAYGDGETIPEPAAWPLADSLFREFVDVEDLLVTFAAVVPLDTLLDGTDAVYDYIAEAFEGSDVELCNTELLTLGVQRPDSWNQRHEGDVVLQVTGTLRSV